MTTRRSALIAAAALLVLALSGCVRFQADLTVTPDDTVNGSLIIAVVVGDESDSRDTAGEAAERIETELLAGVRGAPGVERTIYDQDGYLGSRFRFRETPLEAFSEGGSDGALTLVRDGDEFVFTGSLDFAPEDAEPQPDADTSNITVQVAFPGNVTASNGTINGTSVRWETSYEQSIEMTARASAIPTGAPGWVGPVIGVAVLGLAIGLVVLVLVIRRRGTTGRSAP